MSSDKTPGLEPIDPYEKRTIINSLKRALAFAESLPEQRSCASCMHLRNGRLCALFDTEPPAEVKQVGCGEWEMDSHIPF
jgi:hypothetical protein